MEEPDAAAPQLARRLGLFDATMIVMGGIIGSGIFMNPHVVALRVHAPLVILAAWAAGGLIALAGALIYAELAARRPRVGGQYAYIRESYHPMLAFVYAWGLLLVTQTGGMAAVAVTFARYFLELSRVALPDWTVAALALAGLTVINCLGVRAGSTAQNVLMVLKVLAILSLIACGLVLAPAAGGAGGHTGAGGAGAGAGARHALDGPLSFELVTAFGAAMVPVLFAYGGWQTAAFVAGEIREPRRNLPRGLIMGVAGVVVLYLAVNAVCVRVLGTAGLARSETPASDVMRSALGFLSQSMLAAPRVYFAMADDGLFFKSVAWLDPRTRVPVVAIALQGALAILIAVSGRYEQILNYVVSVDWIFFALAASCVFVLRKQDTRAASPAAAGYEVPGHPVTTAAFIAVSLLVVANTVYKYPANSAIGLALLLLGVPAYLVWKPRGRSTSALP